MSLPVHPARCSFAAVLALLCCVPAPSQSPRFARFHRMLPQHVDLTTGVAVGDVDADGDLDVLVGNDGQNRLYHNDGLGLFTDATAPLLPTSSEVTKAVVLADVDSDGDLDAVFGNDGQNQLYLNDGAGAFTDATASRLPARTDTTCSVAAGDFDGDSDLDLVFGNYGQNRLYLNDGTGVFSDRTGLLMPPDSDTTFAVTFGDVDGDGDLDLLCGNGHQDRLYLNVRSLGGSYADVTSTHLPVDSIFATAAALGDVDGDGDLDAVLGDSGAPSRLYLNDGSGVFRDATASQMPAAGTLARALALADVDGDGDLDALIGNWNQQDGLYLNDGSGVFVDATATHMPHGAVSTTAIALGDLDGDGDLDAHAGNFDGTNCLYANDGRGRFAEVSTPPLPPFVDASAIALGDVDADGDLDAFANNGLHLNDGDGTFTDVTATQLPAFPRPAAPVALGDVDGDGDLDAMMGVSGIPGGGMLFVNDGGGMFTDVTATHLPGVTFSTPMTPALALGDVDGDGDLDALLGSNGVIFPSQDRLFLNDGTGVFTDATATHLPADNIPTFSVAFGDVDGDGDLDALIGTSGQNRLYRNDGSGVFANVTATHLPAALDQTISLALGDVDGDGDLDALIGNSLSLFFVQQNRLYLNDGAGAFVDASATHLPAAAEVTNTVALGDVDLDGDLDAFIGNENTPFPGQNRLYHNDGRGVFVEATGLELPDQVAQATSVALGDLDGDEDLDAVLGASGQGDVMLNRTRHLTWHQVPRVGKPLTMNIAGPPGTAFALNAASATAMVHMPFGTLRLDLASLLFVGWGNLDPGGHGSVTLAIPANPSLVGHAAYWQAAVISPLALTNLETTTLTAL